MGYENVGKLIELCKDNKTFISDPWSVLASLAQIHDFYDYIESNLLSSVEIMETNIIKTTDELFANEKYRTVLRVRRLSRILGYLIVKGDYSALLSVLSELYLECLRPDIYIYDNRLSRKERQNAIQFENAIKYESVLYEREIISEEINNLFDINEHLLTSYLNTCVLDHGCVCITNIQPQIQIPLQVFCENFGIDARLIYERNNMRQELMRDRYSFKLTDEYILDRIYDKSYFSNNSRTTEPIVDILKRYRWIVLLGEPGSGKTSILRYFAHSAASNILNSRRSTDDDKPINPFRVPIFIRLLLFAKACLQSKTWSLLDYICTLGNSSDEGQMLKNEIFKGNTLLLLDGLDEVSTFEGRQKILCCVRDFIEHHVLSPNLISPFDDTTACSDYQCFLNSEPPSKVNGNQIIITSRFVGYDTAPLLGHRIIHCVLMPLESTETEKFIDHWFLCVQKATNKETDFNESNQAKNDKIDLRKNCLKEALKYNAYLRVLAKNPMLLSMLCVWFYHDKVSQFPTQRIELYKESIELLLRNWSLAKGTMISEDIIIWILVDVAMHMHEKEQSGLIDHFVLVRVCTYSLQAWHEKSDESTVRLKKDFENDAKIFVQVIDQDLGLLVARGEQVYGFIQMTFQEYFACLRLVDYEFNEENVEQVFTNFLSYIRNPRFRLPLILAIEWLSIHWTFQNFNQLCEKLVFYENINVPFPLGSILLIECYKDCCQKLNEDIFHHALDHFAQIHSKSEWNFYYPSLGDQFCSVLEILPPAQSNRWLLQYLDKASSSEIIDLCCLFHRYIDKYYSIAIIPQWIDVYVYKMLSDFCFHDTEENGYRIERFLQFINTYGSRLTEIQDNTLPLNRLRAAISNLDNSIHPVIVASILAISGGLGTGTSDIGPFYFEEFNCQHLYRDSVLFSPLAAYLEHDELPHENRIIRLSENCEEIIQEYISDDNVSLPVIDAFTVLLCIKGMHDQKLYQHYKQHRGFHMAIRRLKKTLFYIRKEYFLPETDEFNEKNETSITYVYKHARIICQSVLQQEILQNKIDIKNMKLDVQEMTYRWMNAVAESLVSLVVNGNYVLNDEPELNGFPLLRWKLPFELKNIIYQNCEIIQQTNSPYMTTPIVSDLICFLSLMIDSYNIVSDQNRQYLDEPLLKSIHNRTHIFFYTYNYPCFLIALIRSHHRALFSCFFNEINQMNDCTKNMALVYLLTESLKELFYKMQNNMFLFLFILELLIPKLIQYHLKGFLIGYLLQIDEEIRETLIEILKEHFNTFDSTQILIDILEKNSIDEDIQIERQYLSRIFYEEQSISNSQREFQLYTTCISLVYLSNTMIANKNGKSKQKLSISEEIQKATSQINTIFFKIHLLNLCTNYDIPFQLLNTLSHSAYFLMINRIYPIMPTTYGDTWINNTLYRFNDLFDGQYDILIQQAVCEALLTIECFKKHIFIRIDGCSWREDIFIWSRVFHFQSPIFYFFSFKDKLNYSLNDGISKNAVNTLHACLYLTSLCIDAQTLLIETESQPITNLFLSDIKKQLKPNDNDDPSLSATQVNTILNYLKMTMMTIDMSKIEIIDIALRRFNQVDEDAYPCLRQWLQFHDHPQLKIFAWHAVLYLPIEDNQIQISILMDLFSDKDYFGMKVREARFNIGQNKTNITSPIVIIERFVEIFRSKYPFSDQWFAERLKIEEVEDLRQLFQREQQLILEMKEKKQSILSLVHFPVFYQRITELFIDEINSVLDNQNINLLTTQQDRCAYLISLMTHGQNSFLKEVFQSVAKPVQTFVWQTIIEDCNTTSKNQMILFDCLYFYYKQVRYALSEDELKVIKDIAEIYKHDEINKIVSIIDENLAIRLTYMANEPANTYSMLFEKAQDDIMYNSREISEYIIRHRIKLLPLFINDLFRSFTLAMNNRMVELSYCSIYKKVAEYLCDFNAVEFFIAIKERSSDGESQYKYLLHALKYSKLLSFYGILTVQLLELLFVDDLNMENLEKIDEQIIVLIKTVSNRSIVEQLNQKLKSKWYMECLLAAKLILHLAQIGVISMQETNDEILNAIKYASTNQNMKWFHKNSLECSGHGGLSIELQRILIQLSSIRAGPNVNVTDLMDRNCNDISLDFDHAISARNLVVCFYDRDAQDSILRESYDEIID